MTRKITAVLCTVLILIQALPTTAGAAEKVNTEKLLRETQEFVLKTAPEPSFGSIGGEWAVFGLARSGKKVPDGYFDGYYDKICKTVSDCNGELHDKKYTEYSRLICALSAIGKNPTDVCGYDLTAPLGDYEKTVWQGVNGAIWALIALDCGKFDIPSEKASGTVATRDLYISRILEFESTDGGFSLKAGSETFDPDITAMALQALAKYTDRSEVENAVYRALDRLSREQGNDGGFETAESCAQCLIALCELGISLEDSRFVKNGKSFADALLTYRLQNGGFAHEANDKEANLMATEQSLLALDALYRYENKKASLYSVSDDTEIAENEETDKLGAGNDIVRIVPISKPDAHFSDISGEKCFEACTELAKRAIINGKSEGIFDPNGKMTRAEFAAITVRALGLTVDGEKRFDDFSEDDWFAGYVNTAYKYGIASGVSKTSFAPNSTITFEEAATMLSRAAKLCGMKTEMSLADARDNLAGFSDYVELSEWAVVPTAVCAEVGIVSNEKLELLPQHEVSRGEIAEMLFNLLRKADLL